MSNKKAYSMPFGVRTADLPKRKGLIMSSNRRKHRFSVIGLVEKFLDNIFEKPQLLSDVAKEMLSDKELAKQFNTRMRKGETEFTVEHGDKKYHYRAIE